MSQYYPVGGGNINGNVSVSGLLTATGNITAVSGGSNPMTIGTHPSYGASWAALWRQGVDYTILTDGSTNTFLNTPSAGGAIYFKTGNNTRAYVESNGYFYANRYYDLANSGYYLDPDGTSYLNALQLSGSTYFRPLTWIQMDGSYGMYWPNTNGAHLHANDQSSYGSLCVRGSRGAWGGIYDLYSGVSWMHQTDGSGGLYRESNSRWLVYHNIANNCTSVGGANTTSGYAMQVNGTTYATGAITSPVYYDTDTTYYVDGDGLSNLNRVKAYLYAKDQSTSWNTGFNNTPVSCMTFHGDVSSGGPTGTWWFYTSMRHSNSSNYWGTQIAYGWEDNANEIYQRNVSGGNWTSWVRYLNTNNYSSYALARGGDTMTNILYFRSNKGSGVYSGNSDSAQLQAYSTDGSAAFMSFHRAGSFAVNMGLDPDNVFRIGGWSAAAGRLTLNMGGDLWSANSMRSSVFYDQNDTAYFVDPAADSITSGLSAKLKYSVEVNGAGSGAGFGLALYPSWTNSNGTSTEPTYGMMFASTATYGTHGSVSNGTDWSTYFTMNSTANRGWIFRNVNSGNVASINNAGYARFQSLGINTNASGTAGEIRATDNITAYYSDERLKTKLGPIENPIEKVKALSGFYFEANETAVALGYQKKREIGVSAQEVQAILPEIVTTAPISDEYLTVRYEKMIPLLIEAIKAQQVQIDELKALLASKA
jgi:hypothetical protein